MTVEPQSMVFSPDQFWTWAMMSLRGSDARPAPVERYSMFWARNAIYHSLGLLGIERGTRILVPAYICRAAVDPLIAYGMEVDFYPVRRDCSLDLTELESRVNSRTRALMAVHYFGFPQDVHGLREICQRHGIAFIEDCAHVLCGDADGVPLGTAGDAAVFSWRKFLPVFDGADLLINRAARGSRLELSKEAPLFTLKVGMNMVDRSLRQSRQPVFRALYHGLRLFERAARKSAGTYVQRTSAQLNVETSSTEFDSRNVSWPMSRLSRWTKAHSNIAGIVEKRRRHYELLRLELASAGVRPVFADLPAAGCPWVLPVFFDSVREAHRLLRARGIPAAAWDGVRHPQIGQGTCVDSDYLYDNLVFLPIHQCLRESDIHRMVEAIRSL